MTADLLTELNLTIEALEAAIPANPKSSANIKMAAQLESEMVRYFGQVAAMVPKEQLGKIYNKYAAEE